MIIVVVSYDELNECPDDSTVIKDVCRLYSNAPAEIKEEFGSLLNNQLSSLIVNLNRDNSSIQSTDVLFFNTSTISERDQIGKYIDTVKADLLVSYNLAGFEMSTLADSLSYNTIDCRQFHIIKQPDLPNKKYLNKLRGLNLFIFEDF